LFHADGQTDIAKLLHAFLNFANAYKVDEARIGASRTERKQGGSVYTLGRTHRIDEKAVRRKERRK